ncbi:hypothetical protein OUZ56_003171 [Daphnia magna]|uniref:Uncharacterized protein n=1 Tax=Daphnia magna TaxID=35525 RepID=A0ABR0A7Y4_9CRUS|nr:hypothetical protein OUZ56_003171 [Daphnia magna]
MEWRRLQLDNHLRGLHAPTYDHRYGGDAGAVSQGDICWPMDKKGVDLLTITKSNAEDDKSDSVRPRANNTSEPPTMTSAPGSGVTSAYGGENLAVGVQNVH